MDTKIKCNNGTFIGKETDGLIIWKGIGHEEQGYPEYESNISPA